MPSMPTTNQPRTCPDCGAAIPADAPAGLCAKCMLRVGFEGSLAARTSAPTASTAEPATKPAPPEIADLQPHFPQLAFRELIGRGGMGAVYQAQQLGLDRDVAVKILPPEMSRSADFAQRFTREAQALARLNHPHIVSIHDVGRAGDYYYFVMEFVEGVNLRQAIHSGALSPAQSLAIVTQICDALQYAHDEGVVHRDIKPENILLDKRGRVKIADFGLAKLLGQEPATDAITAHQQVMGTPRYMAPEQMQGLHAADHRADIYSLGVVFYELLTGEPPIGRFSPPSQKVQVDMRIDEVVLRTLEREPDLRYQRASDVKTAIEQLTSELKVPRPTGHRTAEADADSDLPRRAAHAIAGVFGAMMSAAGVAMAVYAWIAVGAENRQFWGWFGVAIVTLVVGITTATLTIVEFRRDHARSRSAERSPHSERTSS